MRLRLRRPLTAAAGICALAAAAGLGASDVAPAVTPAAAAPVVLISPDAVHVRTAMAVPPTLPSSSSKPPKLCRSRCSERSSPTPTMMPRPAGWLSRP